MHADELKQLHTFKYEKKRNDYLLGRYACKGAIQQLYPKYSPIELNISSGVFGQPILLEPETIKIQLSISHTDFIGAALVFPEAHPMGIDIEFAKPNFVSAIVEQFTERELALIKLLHIDQCLACTAFWTIKEALGKTIKCGITIPLQLFEICTAKFNNNGVLVGEFSHFIQYKSLSYFLDDHVCTIILPRNTSMQLNLTAVDLNGAASSPYEIQSTEEISHGW